MYERLDIADFLPKSQEGVLLDVRSPAEYASGHIPWAVSFPLFDDAERAEIGTIYKQQGNELAVKRGLEIVGPKMATMFEQAKLLSGGNTLYVHCWRGGMRSGSVAEFLHMMGLSVVTLVGGYKAYRKEVVNTFLKPWRYAVVGGKTGSGKTAVLHQLRQMGEQVIDLEKLARHKGSAFGAIGEGPQPSSEQFSNELHLIFSRMDLAKTVWIEDESIMIGKVHVPSEVFLAYRKAPLYVLEVDEAARMKQLLSDYGKADVALIIECFRRIERRLGGQHLQRALDFVENGQAEEAIKVALQYYDRAYEHDLERRTGMPIILLNELGSSPAKIASKLMALQP